MVSNEPGQQLHGRAVRGKTLSVEERAQLDAWYAEMDRAEMAMLSSTAPAKAMESLRAEADAELERIITITKRIQKTVEENEALRHEISRLYHQLAERSQLHQPQLV